MKLFIYEAGGDFVGLHISTKELPKFDTEYRTTSQNFGDEEGYLLKLVGVCEVSNFSGEFFEDLAKDGESDHTTSYASLYNH